MSAGQDIVINVDPADFAGGEAILIAPTECLGGGAATAADLAAIPLPSALTVGGVDVWTTCTLEIWARFPRCVGDACPPVPEWYEQAGSYLPLSGAGLGVALRGLLLNPVMQWALAILIGGLVASAVVRALMQVAEQIARGSEDVGEEYYEDSSDRDDSDYRRHPLD